jgi:hypothetical protein
VVSDLANNLFSQPGQSSYRARGHHPPSRTPKEWFLWQTWWLIWQNIWIWYAYYKICMYIYTYPTLPTPKRCKDPIKQSCLIRSTKGWWIETLNRLFVSESYINLMHIFIMYSNDIYVWHEIYGIPKLVQWKKKNPTDRFGWQKKRHMSYVYS